MSVADNIIIFDNSHDKHQLLYAWHHGEVIETIPEKDKPDWLKKVIAEYNILNADITN